ncbi:uncharacterized protein LOC135392238 [Ornithodoros turicata]|uniref:uncharacterized protein LOC135392238 n=1 Tax=Ornithodoros turicata TaxID=34597 RepID=UPI0031386186
MARLEAYEIYEKACKYDVESDKTRIAFCLHVGGKEVEGPTVQLYNIRHILHTESPDGTPWEPSQTTVICSCHFVGNEKSADQTHPSYVPSVFPAMYKAKSVVGLAPVERYERLLLSITKDSGFIDLVEVGDLIVADKGFPGINSHLGQKGALLVMPPFSSGNAQFTTNEMDTTYYIAQVRVHVERVIQRIKTFDILNSTVPAELVPYMTDIFRMCAVLANLQPPIFKTQQ